VLSPIQFRSDSGLSVYEVQTPLSLWNVISDYMWMKCESSYVYPLKFHRINLKTWLDIRLEQIKRVLSDQGLISDQLEGVVNQRIVGD